MIALVVGSCQVTSFKIYAFSSLWEDDDSRVDGSINTMDQVDDFINILSKDIHERILSIDGESVKIGSANWTAAGTTCDNLGTVSDGAVNLTSLSFEGSIADAFETSVTVTNPTADRTVTLPDANSVTLPTGAVFFMLTGSCPPGTTDVTATYADRFLKVNATQGTTAGPTLTGTSDSHTLTTAEIPAHTHTQASGDGLTGQGSLVHAANGIIYQNTATSSTGGGGGHTHTLSAATTLEPKSFTCKMCSVN